MSHSQTSRSASATDATQPEILQVGDIKLDTTTHLVTRADRLIKLAPFQFALLRFLMEHTGQPVKFTEIYQSIATRPASDGQMLDRIKAQMYNLREALGRPNIITAHNDGYQISDCSIAPVRTWSDGATQFRNHEGLRL